MRVTAVGDCGVDRYLNLEADRPGGVSLNVAVNARRWFPASARVGVVSALGNDPEAGFVRAAIDDLEVESWLVEREGQTSIQYIDREFTGEKVFVRYEAGVLGDYRIAARERAVIAESDLLIAALYAEIVEFFESVIEAPSAGLRAVDFGALVNFDDPVGLVEGYAGRFDVGFFGLRSEETPLIDALEAIARRAGRLFIVTLGAGGSMAIGAPERLSCPATPVDRVVDTTGAGDCFAAAFMARYIHSRDIAASLRHGADAAAESVVRVGAFEAPMTPWGAR